jgi:hypothetical protein
MHDVMAEPIVHLVMRRDRLTAGDIWAVVKEAQRQQCLKIEANAASRIPLAADEESRDAS